MKKAPIERWAVYLLRCADGTLYAGVSTDVARRVAEHNGSGKGAKYTRARRPVSLIYTKRFKDRSAAQKQEAAIKALSRRDKLALAGNADAIVAGTWKRTSNAKGSSTSRTSKKSSKR